MKAITVRQPWADLVANGTQHVLTTRRRTGYRGRLVVHTAGAIVAAGQLVDCAPIGGPTDFSTGLLEGERPTSADHVVVVHHPALGFLDEALVLDDPERGCSDISDQLPYGGFRPGRWALLLKDVRPVEARCPACWGSGSYPYPTRMLCVLRKGRLRVPPVPARGKSGVLWDWEPGS